MYILVDGNSIITCIASHECNLHQHFILAGHKTVKLDPAVTDYSCMACGDEYDAKTKQIISHPENHVKPDEATLAEIQIIGEMRRLAVENLKARGILPTSFVDAKAIEIKAITAEMEKQA